MDKAGAGGLERMREDFYLWEIPGKPVAIRLSHQAMDRILMEALGGLGRLSRGRGIEVGGLLLGSAERYGARREVRIEDFQPVPCEHAFGPSYLLSENDQKELSRALEKWKRAPDRRLYAVGYWRSHTREDLGLRAEDLELLARYFAHPGNVALLIRPRMTGPAVAGFFFWEDGRIHSEAPYRTFEFERPLARRTPAGSAGGDSESAVEDAPVAKQAGASAAGGEAPESHQARRAEPEFRFSMFEHAPRKPRRRWLWGALGALLLMLLAAATVAAAARGLIQLPHLSAWRDPFSVSLAGQDYGDNVHLTWDREAPAIRGAERGILTIADGGQNRRLELSPEQLRQGSVVYRRISERVSFRLELILGRRSLSEYWSYEAPPAGGHPSGGAKQQLQPGP